MNAKARSPQLNLVGTGHHRQSLTRKNGLTAVGFFVFFFSATLHSMQDLSSLTRDRTHTPCIDSVESQALDHQRSHYSTFGERMSMEAELRGMEPRWKRPETRGSVCVCGYMCVHVCMCVYVVVCVLSHV